jgi:hypothetical protein
MSTLVKVARYHLVQPYQYLAVTWGILAFTFVVNVVIFGLVPVSHHMVATANGLVSVAHTDGRYTGALSCFFIFFLVFGIQSIGKSLPFGLALGVSRRSYYAGTALLAVALACADGLVLTGFQAIERATDGWGVHMSFFRVVYLLDGPWYLTWLTPSSRCPSFPTSTGTLCSGRTCGRQTPTATSRRTFCAPPSPTAA